MGRGTWGWIAGMLVLALVLFGAAMLALLYTPQGRGFYVPRMSKGLIGQSEELLPLKLGQPTLVLTPEDLERQRLEARLPATFEPMPDRLVTGKLYVYIEEDWAEFVYVDARGFIEAAHTAEAVSP